MQLEKGWKKREIALDHIYRRWLKEYLLLLRSANHSTMGVDRKIQEGNVVLVHEDKVPRSPGN